MSIQSQITRIINAKAAIKAAVEGKGVTVPSSTKLDEMAEKINAISTGITPSGTKNITANGTYDVTQFASAAVNVKKIWTVLIPSTVKTSAVLVTDSYFSDHYSDESLLVIVFPKFTIPLETQCTVGCIRGNGSPSCYPVTENDSKSGIRFYHSANGAYVATSTISGLIAGGSLTLAGETAIYTNGQLKINASSNYPLLPGEYVIYALSID